MRIAKNTSIVLEDAPTSRFLLVVDVMDGAVTLVKNEKKVIELCLCGTDVLATLTYPDGRTARLLAPDARGKEIILTAGYARIGLYVNGVLYDEDFFFTPLDYKDAHLSAGSFMHFEAGYEYHSMSESGIVENITDTLDPFTLTGTEYTVLRVLPCAVKKRLHLFYLDSRHGGRAKDGRGAHKMCAMFSDDGEHFHGAPIALPIDNVREQSMLDGSLLYHEGRYYLYYLVQYETRSALSCAVSEDGFSFQKTGLDIEIQNESGASLSSVALLEGDTPRIYFTARGEAYFADSIDLLHFGMPTPLPALAGFDKLIPLRIAEQALLFAQKDGTLYRVESGVPLPVPGTPPFAYPVYHGGALRYIGIRNGAIVTK